MFIFWSYFIFRNGVPIDYSKGRTAKDFINFILDQSKAAVTAVTTVAEVQIYAITVT